MARSLAITGAEIAERSYEAEKSLVKELAQRQTRQAFTVLRDLMKNARSETVRRQAASDILAWGWGRPSMQIGPGSVDSGMPLIVNINVGDSQRRVEIPVPSTEGAYTQLREGD